MASGAGISLSGRVLGRGLNLLIQILLARQLGPEWFGVYAIGWTLLRVLGLIAPLGLDSAVLHFSSPFLDDNPAGLRTVILKSLAWAIGSGSLVGLAIFVLAPWLGDTIFGNSALPPVLRAFAPAYALVAGLRVAEATTRLSQRMRYSVLAEFLAQPAVNLGLVVLAHIAGLGLLGAAWAAVISFGVAFLLAMYFVIRLFPEVTGSGWQSFSTRRLLGYSITANLAASFSVMILWVDRLVVGYFQTSADVGIYQAISQASLLFAVILGALSAIFAPMIGDLHASADTGRLEELFRISTRWGIYIAVPYFLVLLFAPGPLLEVVFGEAYLVGAVPLMILSVAQMVNIATGAVNNLLILSGEQRAWFKMTASMLALSITLNILLIPRWSLIGAAVATTIAVSGQFIGGLVQVKRLLGIWPYDVRLWKGLLATLVSILALAGLRAIQLPNPASEFFVVAVVAVVLFWSVLLFSGLEPEDREFITWIRAKIRS